MIGNFGPIFEQNANINFEPIFKKSVNYDPILEKSVDLGWPGFFNIFEQPKKLKFFRPKLNRPVAIVVT